MDMVKGIYSIVLLTTVITSVFYFIYSYRRRNIPCAKNFMIMLLSIVLYNSTYLLEINSSTFEAAFFWYQIEHIAIPIQPYIWLLISLDFVGTTIKNKKIIKILGLIHPIVFYLIYYTNPIHKEYDKVYTFQSNGHFNIIFTEKGLLYNFVVVTGTLLVTSIVLIYIKNLFSISRTYRYNCLIMIIASIFPWFSVYFYQSSWNTLNLDYIPIALIISEIIFLYGIFKYRIMSTIPIAHNMIFQQSREGILLADLNDYIIDSNNTFEGMFPRYNTIYKKNTLSSFLSQNKNVKDCIESDSLKPFVIKNGENKKYFSVKLEKILIDDDVKIGKMLIITDITMFINSQNELERRASVAIEKAESSEIAFLQSQIKPHFLNNTLTLISSMITREPEKAKEIIVDLSEYLMNCYQFDENAPMITLEEELEFIKTYVTIEKARFMERLEVKIICEEIPEINIPRLILQPLVENAIRHGVLKKANGGTVELKIIKSGDLVLFQVRDNGIGIAQERISNLLEGAEENQGVGIINIHKRLVKYYGEGLIIKSKLNSGSCVQFQIPYKVFKK